ncbi:MAG TPA: sigma-70 family RNA polymerase sigma factor [Gemmataceae bacterium]|jgi:RNA polymerase sigma-70 factor (ECF subfamily)|nr:sigma-70 family RNA polymerase sigma factor [Gemmataceae bacterium]
MDRTPASLLEQVRNPCDAEAWKRFVQLYTPLLYSWTRRLGMSSQDAADMVQDIFVVLVQTLPMFSYDPRKSFRAWLRTILLNKWRDKCQHEAVLAQHPGEAILAALASPASAEGSDLEEQEYQQHLVSRALEVMENQFQSTTWRACWETVVAGRPVEEVAGELGISVNAVYVAKSRVLRRLRQELEGLLD